LKTPEEIYSGFQGIIVGKEIRVDNTVIIGVYGPTKPDIIIGESIDIWQQIPDGLPVTFLPRKFRVFKIVQLQVVFQGMADAILQGPRFLGT